MRNLNARPGYGAPLTAEEVKDLTSSRLNVHIGGGVVNYSISLILTFCFDIVAYYCVFVICDPY
jgi:hypothetical protein